MIASEKKISKSHTDLEVAIYRASIKPYCI